MKTLRTEIVCPTCKGTGCFAILMDFPEDNKKKDISEKVKSLRGRGITLRQIGAKLGIKNAGLVHYYLKKQGGGAK